MARSSNTKRQARTPPALPPPPQPQLVPSPPQPLPPGYVTVRDAAAWLSLSRATIYNLMAAGELRYFQAGRARRISMAALADYARAHEMAGGMGALA